jgi:hypothetical protein
MAIIRGIDVGATVPALLLLCTLLTTGNPTIIVLIDTGCLQTNITSSRVAFFLNFWKRRRNTLQSYRYDTSVVLTSGVGERSYGVQGIMNSTILFPFGNNDTKTASTLLRAVVCTAVTTDSIIGLPTITYFKLFTIIQAHISPRIVVRYVLSRSRYPLLLRLPMSLTLLCFPLFTISAFQSPAQ